MTGSGRCGRASSWHCESLRMLDKGDLCNGQSANESCSSRGMSLLARMEHTPVGKIHTPLRCRLLREFERRMRSYVAKAVIRLHSCVGRRRLTGTCKSCLASRNIMGHAVCLPPPEGCHERCRMLRAPIASGHLFGLNCDAVRDAVTETETFRSGNVYDATSSRGHIRRG